MAVLWSWWLVVVQVSLMEYNAKKAQRTLRQQTQQAQQTQMLLGADS